jgi:hypothetical protein
LLTLSRESAKAEMIAVSTIHSKAYDAKVLKTFTVKPSANGGIDDLAMT